MTTPLYAALLALFYIFLSVRTLRLRHKTGISIGDGGSELMLRAMRVHANFAEYVPIALLLIFFVEATGGGKVLVHFLAGLLVLGRSLHAFGVSRSQENFRFRVSGMALTFAAIITSSVALLGSSLLD